MIPAIAAALGGSGGGAAAGAAAGASGSISTVASSLAGMQATAGQAAGAVGQVKGALTSLVNQALTGLPQKILHIQALIVNVAKTWTDALAAPIDTVKQLGDAISRFTRLSNPAIVKMFEYRVENAFATIGRTLEPIMNSLVRAAERMGDTFAKLRPVMDPAVRIVADLVDHFSGRFEPVMRDMVPLIQSATNNLRLFSAQLKILSGSLELMLKVFKYVPTGLMDQIGRMVGGGKFDEAGKSDIAIRQPQFTNTEEMQREMARNSLMASLGGGEKKKTTESWLEQILNWLEANISLEKITEAIQEGFRDFIDKNDPTKEIRAGAEDFTDRAGGWIERRREEALDLMNRARRNTGLES